MHDAPTAVAAASPLPCPTCDGARFFCHHGRCDPRCSDDPHGEPCKGCNGTGVAKCDEPGCDEHATRTAAGDTSILVCAAHGEQSDRDYDEYLRRERRDQDLEAFGPSTASTRRILAEEGWS